MLRHCMRWGWVGVVLIALAGCGGGSSGGGGGSSDSSSSSSTGGGTTAAGPPFTLASMALDVATQLPGGAVCLTLTTAGPVATVGAFFYPAAGAGALYNTTPFVSSAANTWSGSIPIPSTQAAGSYQPQILLYNGTSVATSTTEVNYNAVNPAVPTFTYEQLALGAGGATSQGTGATTVAVKPLTVGSGSTTGGGCPGGTGGGGGSGPADLVVTIDSVTNPTAFSSQITYTVTNNGGTAASSFIVMLWADRIGVPDYNSAQSGAFDTVSSLAAGASAQRVVAGPGGTFIASTSYTAYALADFFKVVTESDDTNNLATLPWTAQ